MSSPPATNRPMTPLEWGMLLALAAVWGGSFVFNGIAVRELPVFTVVVSRVALAAIILLVILRIRGERLPRGRAVWTAFFGMGLLNNVIPFSLIVWGQQHIASGVASRRDGADRSWPFCHRQVALAGRQSDGRPQEGNGQMTG